VALTSTQIISSELAIPLGLTAPRDSSKLAAPQGERQVPRRAMAPPGLLRCLVVSWSDQRAELFRSAAESEAWQAVVCQDMGQFMRQVFRMKFPLTIVDLPPPDADGYSELREAAARSREVSKSLLVVSVAQASANDELWARQLGVWAHLPEASDSAGLEMVFREARKALARQAICHSERSGRPVDTGRGHRVRVATNNRAVVRKDEPTRR